MKIAAETFFRILIPGIFLFAFQVSVAQTRQADSLRALIAVAKADTAHVDQLWALSKILDGINPEEGIEYGNRAIILGQRIGYKSGLAQAYKWTGVGYFNKGMYIDAIRHYERSLALFDTVGDRKGVASMYSNIGNIYYNQGDDEKATEYYFKSLKVAEEIGDSVREVTILNNIGAVYTNKKANYGKALRNLWKALPLCEAIGGANPSPDTLILKQDLIGATTVNIGEIYLKQFDLDTSAADKKRDIDSALYYFDKSEIALGEESENLPYTLNNTGNAYMKIKEYDKAISFQTRAFEKAKKLDARNDMAISLLALAQTHFAKGDLGLALNTFKEAEPLAKETQSNYTLKDIYEGLADIYGRRSDLKNAFRYQNLLIKIKDDIYNLETDKKLGTLQFTYDLEKKESQISLLTKDNEIQQAVISRQKLVRNGFIGGFAVMVLFAGIFFTQRNRISKEKKRSEELLLNILPEDTAEELKLTGKAKTKSYEAVTVMFTDFKGFTMVSEKLTPEELVDEINYCFSEYDRIIMKNGIEKIKTIGDAYMCVGGLPVVNSTHAQDVVKAGIEIQQFMAKMKEDRNSKGQRCFELRLGIHSGPVVAGIVGIKKFAYDIWGDTVNTASRIESSGEVGKVNISGTTYELIKDNFRCEHRGKIKAKNKGDIDMYFVEGYL